MGDRYKTRHYVAEQPKRDKVIAYFGQTSTAGHAPSQLGAVQLDPKNADMLSIKTTTPHKTPLINKTQSRDKLATPVSDIPQSPKSPRRNEKVSAAKHSASTKPKPRKSTSRSSMDVDSDAQLDLEEEGIREEMDLSEPVGASSSGAVASSRMDESLEMQDLEAPKGQRKRSRTSMTPKDAELKKTPSSRFIATKRSAAAAVATGGDAYDNEEVDTPKKTGKARSQEDIRSPHKKSPLSRDKSSRSAHDSPKPSNLDALELDAEPSSRPPRKKTKIRETSSSNSLASDAVVRSSSSPSSVKSDAVHTTPKSESKPSLWKNYVPRALRNISFFGSSSPQSSPSGHSLETSTTREVQSEPIIIDAPPMEDYADSIASPNYRAFTSLPQGVSGLPSPNPNYNQYPDAARPSAIGQLSSPRFFPPSPSRGISSPHVPSTRSPTAYLGSPQRIGTPNTGIGYTTPYRPQPQQPHQPLPSHIIPASPSSRRVFQSPPLASTLPHHSALDHQPLQKHPKRSFCDKARDLLRNVFFVLLVGVLLALVVHLFFNDMLRKMFATDPARINQLCADQLKDVLQRRRGSYECGLIQTPSISAPELSLQMTSLCPLWEKDGLNRQTVLSILSKDALNIEVLQNSYYYKGPHPIKPIMCAIRQGLWELVRANAGYLFLILSVCGLILWAYLALKRRRSDQDLVRKISNAIIEKMKEEGPQGYIVRDYMESDYTTTSAEKRVWSQVVDTVEGNIRVRALPKVLNGDQLVTWVWTEK